MYEVNMFYPGKVRSNLEKEFDDKIYGRWASGYSFEDNIRDIAFSIETLDLVRDLMAYLPCDGWITVRLRDGVVEA